VKASQNLPDGYHVSDTFDFSNRKFIIWLNALGIIALIIFLFLFGAVFMLLRPEAFGEVTISTDTILDTILFIVVMAAAIFTVLVLHELIHGFFFWLFSGQKPLFGFKGIYAYATLPGWYFPRNPFLVIAIAPLVLISILGILMVPLVPFNSLWIIYLALVVNASGSVGDLVASFRLILKPKTTMAQDNADIITFYTPE
jgi:hypothetical protein